MKIGYVRLLASRMGLGDWKITMGKALPADGPDLARIDISYGRKRAVLHLSLGVKEIARVDQRHTLVHELIHCYLEPVRLASLNWTSQLGAKAAQMAVESVHYNVEFAVDAMATAWAPCLPLPED